MELVYLPYQIDGINLHIKEVLNQVLSTYYIKSKNCYDKVGIWQTLTTLLVKQAIGSLIYNWSKKWGN